MRLHLHKSILFDKQKNCLRLLGKLECNLREEIKNDKGLFFKNFDSNHRSNNQIKN